MLLYLRFPAWPIFFAFLFCLHPLSAQDIIEPLPPSAHGGKKGRVIDLQNANNSSIQRTLYNDFLKFSNRTRGLLPGRRKCGTMEMEEIRHAQRGGESLNEFEGWLQDQIEEERSLGQRKAVEPIFSIPVVVHVIYSAAEENISEEQIQSQLEVLIEDYRRQNSDTINTDPRFRELACDTRIEFCLASVDPAGHPTDGIDRISVSGSPFTENYINRVIKPNTIWDPSRYLNLWVCNIADGILGYAQFPSSSGLSGVPEDPGSAETDGVVIHFNAFGTMGTALTPFNKGRTATHEIGHWLGLRHIWGDGDCDIDDFCDDTPPSNDAHYGCPTGVASCTEVCMVENFMDYTNDECMNSFTRDQKMRMRTVLTTSPRRKELVESSVCEDVQIAPITQFDADLTLGCPPFAVRFRNQSKASPESFFWNFPGGTPSSSTEENPLITYTRPGSYGVTLTTKNVNGATTAMETGFVSVSDGGWQLPYEEDFEGREFPPRGAVIHNPDADSTWHQSRVSGAFGQSLGAMRFDNYRSNLINAQDVFILPALDLSAGQSTYLAFDVAYAQYSDEYSDTLGVFISGDCGTVYQNVYYKGGKKLATSGNFVKPFVPFQEEWRTEVIDLSEFDGLTDIRIAFVNMGGYGNRLYLDNIRVNATPKPAPEANFDVENPSICQGETIHFHDRSINEPEEWIWTFPGGLPASDTSRNPIVSYPEAGVYNVKLTVRNVSGVSTMTMEGFIRVKPAPSVKLTTSSNKTCKGASVSFIASGAERYEWMPVAYLDTTRGNAVKASPEQTTTFLVQAFGPNGCSAVEATTIHVEGEALTISPPKASVCEGEKLSLQAEGADSYQWFDPKQKAISSSNELNLSPSQSGKYTLKASTQSGCEFVREIPVEINAKPTVQAMTDKKSVCSGESVRLQARGANRYIWKDGEREFTEASFDFSPRQSTNFRLIGLNEKGCTDSTDLAIKLLPQPTLKLTPDKQEICYGESITLTASGADRYAWFPAAAVESQQAATIIAKPQVTSTYTLIGESNTGCKDTVSYEIPVNPAPTVLIETDQNTLCAGKDIQLEASGASRYSWSNSVGKMKATTGTVSDTPDEDTDYEVVGYNEAGCSDTAFLKVKVATDDVPRADFSAEETTICAGQSVQFWDKSENAINHQWFFENGIVETAGLNPVVRYEKPGKYTVRLEVIGCNGEALLEREKFITVTAPAPLKVNMSDVTICKGDAISLKVSGAENISWSPAAGLDRTNGSSVLAAPLNSLSYTVSGTTDKGCKTQASIQLNVKGSGKQVKIQSDKVSLCAGETMTLKATNAASYQWKGTDGLISKQAEISISPNSSHIYTLTGTDVDGCRSSDTLQLKVHPSPSIQLSASADATCDGRSVELEASGATTYKWSPAQSLSSASQPNVEAFPTQNTTYTVLGTDENGCSAQASKEIRVQTSSKLSIQVEDTLLCKGQSTQLIASGGSQYEWSPADGLSSATGASITATPSMTRTYTVSSMGEDGCVSRATATVKVRQAQFVKIEPNPAVLCRGASLRLSASGGKSYEWLPNAAFSGSASPEINISPDSSSLFHLRVTDENGCEQDASIWVEVDQTNELMVTTSQRSLCVGERVELTATGGSDYQWIEGDGMKSRSGSKITAEPSQNTRYIVIAKDENGCLDTAKAEVVVSQLSVDFKMSASKLDLASDKGMVEFEALADGATVFDWQFGENAAANGDKTTHIFTEIGTYNIILTASDDMCSLSKQKQVVVENSSSIQELRRGGNIRVYPNPTNGKVTLEIKSNREMSLKMRLLDSSNKTRLLDVLSIGSETYQQTLDLGMFEKGKYKLQLTDGEEEFEEVIIYE